MPTDPFAGNGHMRKSTVDSRLSDLEDSLETVKEIAARSVTTIDRAYDVASQARETVNELKEVLSNNSTRMRELERSVRSNSQVVGDMQATLISIDKTVANMDRRLGKWPIEPDDRGSGLMGKVHAMGAQMGMSEHRPDFDRSSYVDDSGLEEQRKKSDELGKQMRRKMQELDGAGTTTDGWEITQARKQAEREALEERMRGTIVEPKRPLSKIPADTWRMLPPGVQAVIITLTTLGGLALGAWQALQAAGIIK